MYQYTVDSHYPENAHYYYYYSDAPTTTALRLHRSLTVTKTNMYHLQDVTLETAQQIEIKRYPRKTCFLYKVRSDTDVHSEHRHFDNVEGQMHIKSHMLLTAL